MKAILCLLAGLSISLTFHAQIRRQAIRHSEDVFRQHARVRGVAFQKQIESHIETLEELDDAFTAFPEMGRSEFARITLPVIKRNGTIHTLAWIPFVPAGERERYERRIQADGFKDFGITERSAQNTIIRAGNRREYYPVSLIEPLDLNHEALGSDMGSDEKHRKLLEQARDAGSVLATAPVALAGETQRRNGLQLFVPVFAGARSAAGHRNDLQGFVAGVFRIGAMMEECAEPKRYGQALGMSMGLFDITDAPDTTALYRITTYSGDTDLHYRAYHHDITAAGRHWQLRFRPTRACIDSRIGRFPRLILWIGVSASVLLSVLVHKASVRAAKIDKLVDEKTRHLKASETKIQTIVDIAVNGIISINPRGVVESYNASAERIFQYRADEVVGKNVNMLMPEPYRTEHDGYIRRYITTHEPRIIGSTREVSGRRKDGSVFPMEISVSEIDQDGLHLFVGLVQDISERKQAEETLRKFSRVIEQSPTTVIITDPAGIIEYVNPYFVTLTGYTVGEAVGRDMGFIKSGEHTAEFYEDLWTTITSGRNWKGEFLNRKKDGSLYWESASISPLINSDGVITHFVAVKEDISERKRVEKELITARSEAVRANQAKSEFLANMSHEIRTPMNAILGMADLLQETPLSELQTEYVSIFRDAGKHLLNIINDILDLSKAEANLLELVRHPFDLRALCEQVITFMKFSARDKPIEMGFSVSGDTETLLCGDLDRLRQILINLIGNAVKFTHEGSIHLGVERRGTGNGQGETVFTVKDTGIGIAPDKVATIFNKFTQADSSAAKKYGGTGLGLSISRKLVQLMGGKIWLESEVGRGTTFHFAVPLAVCDPAQRRMLSQDTRSRHPQRPSKRIPPLRILLAEDNPNNSRLIIFYLQKAGHSLELADDGSKAVRLFEDNAFDLVLMDMQMPVMDGYTATRAIRRYESANRRRPTPVIALTAYATEAEIRRSLDAGCDSHLCKPISRNELLAAIAKVPPPAETVASSPSVVVDEELRDLVAEYVKSLRETATELRSSLESGAYGAVKRIGHGMKGSGSSYGFNEITEIGERIEAAGNSGEPEATAMLITRLEQYLENVTIEFHTRKPDPKESV